MKTQEHTAGAMRIARLIAGDDESCVFIRGDNANFDERGWTTQDDLAAIIDRETHAPQLLEALVQLEEEVDSLRKGITWSRDYVGVIQAQLRAKEAIRSAKGEL